MTAVANPPNFQSISRAGWTGGSGGQSGINSMSGDEVSRMFMPRKSVQRTSSSSSLASSTSSASTISGSSAHTNGVSSSTTLVENPWASRKKQPRAIWPASKAEPMAGLSTARSQSVASASVGPSAASAISALHTPGPMLSSQLHSAQSQNQQNGPSRSSISSDPPAILHLLPLNGTFERKTINVPFFPEVLRIGRQTNQKTVPTPMNGYFDSKVLSRQHAEVWADRNGKIWIRDVKSSNGTFVNGQRLSQESKDSDPHELREHDGLELGIDIVSEDGKTVVHHKVAARVEHAGLYTNNPTLLDLSFGDLDPLGSGGLTSNSFNGGLGPTPRPRTGSQGSIGSNGRMGSAPAIVAGSNLNAISQQRHMNFWLTPISMEQIVKRLNGELKRSKQQSHDLTRAGQCLESVLAPKPKRDSVKPVLVHQPKSSPIKDNSKPRFSEPPAPPPQQPLPEKPDAFRALPEAILPLLRRNDTERPQLQLLAELATKSDPSHQIVSLVEALHTAKQEIDSQSSRLKDLEGMLAQERSARESAEERAQSLEMISRSEADASDATESSASSVNDSHTSEHTDETPESSPPSEDEVDDGIQPNHETELTDTISVKLQQRLDTLLVEMHEMKQQMEGYRRRAEEAEEESARDRHTLAEMVEKIRTANAEHAVPNGSKVRSPDSHAQKQPITEKVGWSANGSAVVPHGNETRQNGVATLFRQLNVQNGVPLGPEQFAELEEAVSNALATRNQTHDQLAQTAPYASILGVVLIGVGLMAYLNGWQKVE